MLLTSCAGSPAPGVTCHMMQVLISLGAASQRPQRHSHSGHGGGPISGDYYYRGQEARSSQEYYSQVSRGCSTHLTLLTPNLHLHLHLLLAIITGFNVCTATHFLLVFTPHRAPLTAVIVFTSPVHTSHDT